MPKWDDVSTFLKSLAHFLDAFSNIDNEKLPRRSSAQVVLGVSRSSSFLFTEPREEDTVGDTGENIPQTP